MWIDFLIYTTIKSCFTQSLIEILNTFYCIQFLVKTNLKLNFCWIGRQFDKDGNNKNWWDSQTDKNFKERAQCIIEQYGNYTVPENGLKASTEYYRPSQTATREPNLAAKFYFLARYNFEFEKLISLKQFEKCENLTKILRNFS